ncbi:zinc ribbon domain-containing protein [Parapedobacter sp. 10938]|uniref:zinc ribbon domain-containing protein n=1 Tax=Parapedobacter flavus TaxID=3110225 RepID=UPI002DB9FA31|nr:C4-type zinc ribbon domain-containing protein [Parapedobacter sp. 10938]MEC3881560.1 C4-type zinc ribbon domain-containing protein [Parapedobacter sp. 10938]
MEQTIEQKLRALWQLQTIHTKVDKIRQVRGELPMEVSDLEDDIAGLETRIEKNRSELDELEDAIVNRRNMIQDAQAAIKKYEGQLNEVKNNREYDAITKEIEIQGLDIQVSEKKIREFEFEIKNKTEVYDGTQETLEAAKRDLEIKKGELDTITGETQKEEDELVKQADEAETDIEERLLRVYRRLRTSYKNGLAVVSIDRDSCSGCHNKIPPQKQLEIRQRKKIIVCEHCGRVLVDEALAEETAPSSVA